MNSSLRFSPRLVVAVAAVVASGLLAGMTPFAASAGARPHVPARAVLFDSSRTGNFEIFMMRDDGTRPVQLTKDPRYDSWWPKISPDRKTVMFVRVPKGVHDSDYKQITTWLMNADGTGVHVLLPAGTYRWHGQGHPEWSPDGRSIVTMCEPSTAAAGNVQICVVDRDGRHPRQVTSATQSTGTDLTPTAGNNRGGINVDPSWRPDGKAILFIGCPLNVCVDNELEVYQIGLDGRHETRLTNDAFRDQDPVYSPDGRTIAWLRQTGTIANWGIMRMRPDGSAQAAVIDDGQINSKPAWSLDSNTLYFHRCLAFLSGYNIWKIRPDGSGLSQLVSSRGAVNPGSYDDEYPVASSH